MPPAAGKGSLVVGVTSPLRPGVDVDRVDYAVTVNGEALDSGSLPKGAAPGAFKFPLELAIADRAPTDELVIDLAGTSDGRPFPVARRVARTSVREGATLLLPLRLDPACGENAQGPLVTCAAGLTCDRGACVDERVPAASLAVYDPAWSKVSTDPCKRDGDAPVVVVGEGQGDYLPLDEGETVQVEAGPQGGHHIWIALRTKGLAQSGSITTLSGEVPSTSQVIEDFRVVFSLDKDDGGYCKLYGLRFQLDATIPIADLLGKQVLVRAKLEDASGTVGTSEKLVTLSNDTI